MPKPLRRTINRVSALLETVDLEFERVLEERKTYFETSKAPKAATEQLNVDSMAAVLAELLPPENKKDDEPYADLLSDLFKLSIKTPERLREILTKHLEYAKNSDRARVAEILAKNESSGEYTVTERVARGVFYAHVGLAREALRAELGEDVISTVFSRKHKSLQRPKGGGPRSR